MVFRSSRNRARISLMLTASLATLGLAAPVMAQDEPETPTADAERDTNEIIVTAQFREQNLQDTPLAITAVDAALLEARNQDSVEEVARQAPSVTLQQMGGAFGNSMGASIRGIGAFDFNPAYEPGVGLYIDDVYYATLTGANFDLLDLERVEILRGPQGTLTGRNSIGGAIKLFSTKPEADTSGSVEAAYGSRNRIEVRGSINFPLAEDLYARVSAVHKSQDGFVDQIDYGCANPGNPEGILAQAATGTDCVVDKLGSINYSGVRGALRYAGSNLEVMVIADYQHSDQTSAGEVMIVSNNENYVCGPFCTYASFQEDAFGQTDGWTQDNRNKFGAWGISGHINFDLNDDIQLQSITAYRDYRNQWGTDDDFSPEEHYGSGGYNDLTFWFFSQELRLNAKVGDLADVTVGGFYSDQRSVYFTIQDIRYIDPLCGGLGFCLLQFQGDDPINADSKAAFATVILHPTESLNITGGLRYTEEHKDYTFHRHNMDGTTPLDPDPFGLGGLEGLTSVYDGDRLDWRLSVDYRFSPQVLAYVSASTGFKGGGVTARPFIPQHAIDGTFGPETVTAFELGLKTDLFDRRLRVNLAGFYNDYKDIQLGLSDCTEYGGGTCAVVANAGDGKMWGFEAELSAEPVDGLSIDGSLSLIGSEYTYIAPAVGTSITEGSPIVSPEVQGSFGIQYEVDLGESGSITPRLDMSYRGKTFAGTSLNAVDPDYEYFPGYWLGNANITWRNEDDDLSIALEVNNLFDEYYYTTRFDAVYAFTGTAWGTIGKPREWRINVRKKF